jgi:hypothetical protein
MLTSNRIRRGQKYRKKHTSSGQPYYAVVVNKAGKRDGWRAVCSDGNTHSFSDRAFLKMFELMEE